MKKYARLIGGAVVAAVLNAPVALAADKREFVKLPDEIRDGVIVNMRDHLQTLLDLLKHLSEGDFEMAANAAETRIGLSSPASHSANYMAPLIPEEMRTIGTRMHTAASRFAERTRRGDLD
ncbi:MAG: hypothetical protein B0D83_01325, partial [Candidatus Sedimenticola endophacoides]